MAIDKTKNSIGLKMTLNYGEVLGKALVKSKTYPDVKLVVADAAVYATAKAIGAMQQPALEQVMMVTVDSLIEIV
ncbi:MAG: hypothetical protein RR310_09155 [Eubacterium sp.]